MTKPDWASIKSDYVETTMTLAEVQVKWEVPRGTLSARATRELWHVEKQQFAANLEQARRESRIAQRIAERESFDDVVIALAKTQLKAIARELSSGHIDAAKTLKLASALEKVQRISSNAFGPPRSQAACK